MNEAMKKTYLKLRHLTCNVTILFTKRLEGGYKLLITPSNFCMHTYKPDDDHPHKPIVDPELRYNYHR